MIINQTLQDFRSYINTHRGIARANRFVVELLDSNLIRRTKFYGSRVYNGDPRTTQQHLEFSARSTSLPSKTLSTNAVEAPGPEQKYPYNDTYDDLTITFMATQGKEHPYGIPEKRFFDAWMNIIVNPENMLVNYSKLYTTNGLHVSLINEKNIILAKYRFDRLYPIGMGAVELGHDSEDPATFEVTFSYDRWHYVTDTEKLETTNEEGEAHSREWNPKIIPFGPQLPNQNKKGTLLESDPPYFIKPKTYGSPLERVSSIVGKAAGKAEQLTKKVGIELTPSRKVARTLAVAKKLKRFV